MTAPHKEQEVEDESEDYETPDSNEVFAPENEESQQDTEAQLTSKNTFLKII